MNQILSMKLWTLIALISSAVLVSVWLTTVVVSQSFHPETTTCPPCKPNPIAPLPSQKVDRVPNDNGETF